MAEFLEHTSWFCHIGPSLPGVGTGTPAERAASSAHESTPWHSHGQTIARTERLLHHVHDQFLDGKSWLPDEYDSFPGTSLNSSVAGSGYEPW